MAATLDKVLDEIGMIQSEAREGRAHGRPSWPMIILKTRKGWTGPKEVDGLKTEGFWRSHQVPFAEMATKPAHVKLLEEWMKSYRPEELFDANGVLIPEIAALAPAGDRRMSANPHATGGLSMREIDLPDIAAYAVKVEKPGERTAKATAVLAEFLRDVIKATEAQRNFRLFGPDETVTACRPSSKRLIGLGMPRSSRMTSIWRETEGSWRSSRSTPANAGSNAIY
jgi:xylulose-5-phosphate/fructose-6-phosphate phosphoketolase